jgi:hypothetical protein
LQPHPCQTAMPRCLRDRGADENGALPLH